MPTMLPFIQGKSFWAKASLAITWSFFPSFLFYLLILQTFHFSLLRLGLSILLVPLFALITYWHLPKFRFFSPRSWIILVIGSGILSFLGSLLLSSYPERTILVSPQHELRIEIIQIAKGESIQINRFQTSFEVVGNDAFQGLTGWTRKGIYFIASSSSPASLTWMGWTGNQARLYLSGSPNEVVNVVWDNQIRVIDFSKTDGHALVQQEFPVPFEETLALILILWGTILYIATLVLVNTKIIVVEAILPSWAGYAFLTGFIFILTTLIVNAPLEYMELLLVIGMAFISTIPAFIIWQTLFQTNFRQSISLRASTVFQKHSTLLIVFSSFLLAIALFGRSVWTNWSVIDDHEIVFFLGPDRKLSLGGMFSILPHTEAGLFGVSARFRPSYYFLRLLECVLWGAHPLYWHAARIVILAIGLSLFWTLMRPTLGWLGSGLLCAYALTFPFWTDIIGRLGPGETYAVAGFPLYIWGTVNALSKSKLSIIREIMAGAAVLIGGIICIGSKENFVLLLLPSLYILYQALKAKRAVLFISALSTIFFAIYVGTSVTLAVSRLGTDVYANSISPLARIQNILNTLSNPQSLIPLCTLIGLILIFSLIYLKRDLSSEKYKSVLYAQFWMIVLSLVYLSQLFFYDSIWPTGNRYDFPGLLYIPAAIFICFWLGKRIVTTDSNNSTFVMTLSLIVALSLAIIWKGYDPIIQSLDQNIQTTNEFTHGIEKMALLLREHENYALVIETGRALDYEPILSYDTFLRAYGVDNKLFLRIHGYSLETAKPGLDQNLTSTLLKISQNGNGDFLPLDLLTTFGDKCFSLNLSGTFATECQPIQ